MKRLPLLILTFFLTSPLLAGEQLSLNQAKLLIEKSPRLRASDSMVDEAKSQERMATGMFYPAITLSHGYMYTNNPVGVFSAKLQQRQFTQADFAIGALNEPNAVHHSHTRFQLAQPLLHSFSDIYQREAAKHGTQAKHSEHDFNLQQAKLEISKLYFTLLTLQKRGEILKEGIAKLQKLENSYSLMEAPTSATTTNFLIAQSVRLNLTAQESGVASAYQELQRLLSAHLGYAQDTQWVLTDPLPEVDQLKILPETQEKLRADVKAAQENFQAAQAAVSAQKASWGPNLDFVAGYNLYSGDYRNFDDAYDVGLQLTWPIFQGPRIGQNDRAKAQLRAAQYMKRAAQLEAQAKQKSSLSNFEARVKEYQVLLKAKEKAERALALAKKRYAQGTLPLFNYSETIQNWVAIQQEVAEAQRRATETHTSVLFERGAL